MRIIRLVTVELIPPRLPVCGIRRLSFGSGVGLYYKGRLPAGGHQAASNVTAARFRAHYGPSRTQAASQGRPFQWPAAEAVPGEEGVKLK